MKKSILLVLLALTAGSLPARAALGGSLDSVRSDQLRLRGQLRTEVRSGYTVHEINSPDGTKVKEFVSPAGKVFGVLWEAPAMPDLSQLLGSYFSEFQQAPRPAVRRHAGIVVRTDRLVVESSGHLRAFHGRAYANDLLPDGITAEVVR